MPSIICMPSQISPMPPFSNLKLNISPDRFWLPVVASPAPPLQSTSVRRRACSFQHPTIPTASNKSRHPTASNRSPTAGPEKPISGGFEIVGDAQTPQHFVPRFHQRQAPHAGSVCGAARQVLSFLASCGLRVFCFA